MRFLRPAGAERTENPKSATLGPSPCRWTLLAGLAELAEQENYCRPQVDLSEQIIISQAGILLWKRSWDRGASFNDLEMDLRKKRIMILTGPNMAGKSTLCDRPLKSFFWPKQAVLCRPRRRISLVDEFSLESVPRTSLASGAVHIYS